MAPSPENADRCHFWNTKFREKVTELKQQHWRSFLASTDTTSVFQAFQFTKPRSGGGILPLKDSNGTVTSDKEEQAKLLFAGTSVVNSACDLEDIPPPASSIFVLYPPSHRRR
ncbi:hypothetical protein PGTUg99_006236 [Puccinia graminis f. sp. tritici]|nr:hypothetical protein PGTUg99_006236 [Puccinia graminis f. sp. tritici]